MGWYTWYRPNDTEECHWLGSLYHWHRAQISCFSGSYLISGWPLIGQGLTTQSSHWLSWILHVSRHSPWSCVATKYNTSLTPGGSKHMMAAVFIKNLWRREDEIWTYQGMTRRKFKEVKQPSVYQISLCAAIKGGSHTRCAFIDDKILSCEAARQNNGQF